MPGIGSRPTELLAARGIIVSHESLRQWALRLGQTFANQIPRRLPRAGDKWPLDDVVIKIAGVNHWCWRAVDQTGQVLDVLVQRQRDKDAARRLLRKPLKRQCRTPRVMITDKLVRYGTAKREVMPAVEHPQHKGLTQRAENSHQPTRRREHQMKRFKSAQQARRFLSAHDQINNPFQLRRHHLPASIEPSVPEPFRLGSRSVGLPMLRSRSRRGPPASAFAPGPSG
jgi:putative transposase